MNSAIVHFILRVIDIKSISPHEEFNEIRAKPLARKIKKMNIFINPILVANIKENHFMQVDGMNRLSAIRMLGIESILAQVVDYNDEDTVDVSTWSHLNKFKKNDFLAQLSKISGLTLDRVGFRYLRRRFIKDQGAGFLASISFKDGSVYRIGANGNLPDKIKTLTKIVNIYKNNLVRDILRADADSVDVQELFKDYPGYKTLVIFPTFTRHQIINIAVHNKVLFPSGVTRFIIKGRCLDVNFPLKYLEGNSSEEEKNNDLKKFLDKREHRLYEEPTIYFEP